MAVKRKLYEKTTNGIVEQLIASSADIVEFNGGDNADLTGIDNAQDAIIKVAELANSGGESVQDIVDGKTKVGHATKADEAEKAIRDGNNNIIVDTYIPQTAKGISYGVATLDGSGKVPTAQLPSYVDDVLEYENRSKFPQTGESGKIYVDLATNMTWRWGGTTYVEISKSLALGETSSTAYAGDKGKANAEKIAALEITLTNVSEEAHEAYSSVTGLLDGTLTAKKAEKLSDAKTISLAGDVTGSVSTDFSSNPNITTTLADSGVEVGTYSTVVVDAKGRVTSGYQVVEFGGDNQDSPHASLVVGGLFFKKL